MGEGYQRFCFNGSDMVRRYEIGTVHIEQWRSARLRFGRKFYGIFLLFI